MPKLAWNKIKSVAEYLLGEEDNWLEGNYSVFNWHFKDALELELKKIKVASIANLYYEFCHEAYGYTQLLPDNLFTIYQQEQLALSSIRLGHLVDGDFLTNLPEEDDSDEDYLTERCIIELVMAVRESLFEEIYSSKHYTPDTLFKSFSSLKQIPPNHEGLVYLESWGDSYQNY